jgi:calcineurin-like phosphoesterase family protein
MQRREFLKSAGLGLAVCWALGRLPWPSRAWGHAGEMRLALLADAHLQSGGEQQPPARALARAVSEIRACQPPPDLVLFAGDLAHTGRADALGLGREILSDLPGPLLLVRGEGDGRAWAHRFGEPRFSHAYRGCHLLGLDTVLTPSPAGPAFALGPEQRRWLAGELARLDPAVPLLILSHAPLAEIFRPWQQWTADAATIQPLLAHFRHVLCLHGHVHRAGVRNQGADAGARGQGAGISNFRARAGLGSRLATANRKPPTANVSLPATSWPRPQALQGTPASPRPGLGPQGCGWLLLSIRPGSLELLPHLWQA